MTRNTLSRAPEYFAKLYSQTPDPWDFANSSYEKAKYRATVAMLGARHFQSAFEIGCSIGILTRMLAQHCRFLLAIDVVDTALAMARDNCAGLEQVVFQNLQVPRDWPGEMKFDLIICSEVLYFLSPQDIARVAVLAGGSLLPGGCILLVNYTGQIDEPCSGDAAAEIFITASADDMVVDRQIRDSKFRIDLLRTRQKAWPE
jgi:SAM-dependent methyltransferase